MHRALASALPTESPQRLYHLLAAGAEDEIAPAALAIAQRMCEEGRGARAVGIVADSLGRLPHDVPAALRRDLLVVVLECGLSSGTVPGLEHALHAIERSAEGDEDAPLEVVARAALQALHGGALRAVESLRSIGEHPNPRVERFRVTVLVVASRYAGLAHEEAAVAEASRRSTARPDAVPAHLVQDWLGWVRYRQGRYREAAELHDRVAADAASPPLRLGALLNAGSAWLEAHEHGNARERARGAIAIAAPRRHALGEARAERILRAADYRSGVATAPDLVLVEAVRGIGSANLEAMVALNEAAVAWRTGDLATARTLAERARATWARTGDESSAALAEALSAAAGAPTTHEAKERLLSVAATCPDPGIAVQILGLVVRGDPSLAADAEAAARRRSGPPPYGDPAVRREVLAPVECVREATIERD
jgi:hypothetical protein